jgi:hypothetical protein
MSADGKGMDFIAQAWSRDDAQLIQGILADWLP